MFEKKKVQAIKNLHQTKELKIYKLASLGHSLGPDLTELSISSFFQCLVYSRKFFINHLAYNKTVLFKIGFYNFYFLLRKIIHLDILVLERKN